MENLTVSCKPVTPYIPLEGFTRNLHRALSKLTGFAASRGMVEGPCTIIRNPQDLRMLQDGAIIVCEVPSPALAPYMSFLKGLIAERGGPLCIAAGYARESEVTAVVGVKGVMDAVRDGDVIRIDGSRGTVEIIG
jgi:phosphohistidine swiveling domain-containing protein